MTLTDYLTDKAQTPTEFAREAGIGTSSITRYLRGERGLSLEHAVKIEKATKGAVRCEDLVLSINDVISACDAKSKAAA